MLYRTEKTRQRCKGGKSKRETLAREMRRSTPLEAERERELSRVGAAGEENPVPGLPGGGNSTRGRPTQGVRLPSTCGGGGESTCRLSNTSAHYGGGGG
jgi:hypothetical protein